MNTEIKSAWQDAIKLAIQYLDNNLWSSKNNSTDYDLCHNGKNYPPKEVFKNAVRFFEKDNPDESVPSLGGGKPTNEFLINLGFNVKSKYQNMNLWKLGCRWDSKNPLFYDFIKDQQIVVSWEDKMYSKNDWLLITDGHTVLAFAQVLETPHSSLNYPEYEKIFNNYKIPFEKGLVVANAKWIELKEGDRFQYKLQQGICRVKNRSIKKRFNELLNKYSKDMFIESIINILKNKKQIILQGPPGTGKTRLAKKIANSLINENSDHMDNFSGEVFSNEYIQKTLNRVDIINSASGKTKYKIVKVYKTKCNVSLTATEASYDITYNGIRKAFEDRLWEKGEQKGGFDPYNAAIAKFLFEQKNKPNNSEVSKTYNLVQFHPSYSYEDFVRGVSVNTEGNHIGYRTENKIIALLAEKAHKNFIDSQKDASETSREQWVLEQFEAYKDHVIDSMDEDGKYRLNKTVNIIAIEEDAFRYTGNTWKNEFRMKYSDLIYLYENNVLERADIKKQASINPLAKTHATYFKLVLDMFYHFMETKEEPKEALEKIDQKNFVLIIDEINRANLSSVLGELIYALEYRGESVESIYDIEGKRSIVLPPNLFIIGTMNTADRSVGYIDYAVRRRFAFVDVLPKVLDESQLEGKKFAIDKFKEVSKLFVSNENLEEKNLVLEPSEHLSEEFKPEDIWLGHSYFIYENDNLEIQLKYEVIPILKEYVKDGILKESALEVINSL